MDVVDKLEFDVQVIYIIFQTRQNITQKVGNNHSKRDKIYVQTGVMIMGWIEGIGEAINYIEENITEEIAIGLPLLAVSLFPLMKKLLILQ